MQNRRTPAATSRPMTVAIGRSDRLEYIAEMTSELKRMAGAADAWLLVSLLDMAHLEASIRAAESHASPPLKS